MILSAFTANLRSIALNCLPHNFLSLRCVKLASPFLTFRNPSGWVKRHLYHITLQAGVDLNQMSKLTSGLSRPQSGVRVLHHPFTRSSCKLLDLADQVFAPRSSSPPGSRRGIHHGFSRQRAWLSPTYLVNFSNSANFFSTTTMALALDPDGW